MLYRSKVSVFSIFRCFITLFLLFAVSVNNAVAQLILKYNDNGVISKPPFEILTNYPSIDLGTEKAKSTLIVIGAIECTHLRLIVETIASQRYNINARLIIVPINLTSKILDRSLELYMNPSVENYFRIRASLDAKLVRLDKLDPDEVTVKRNYVKTAFFQIRAFLYLHSVRLGYNGATSPLILGLMKNGDVFVGIGKPDFKYIEKNIVNYKFTRRVWKSKFPIERIYATEFSVKLSKSLFKDENIPGIDYSGR